MVIEKKKKQVERYCLKKIKVSEENEKMKLVYYKISRHKFESIGTKLLLTKT